MKSILFSILALAIQGTQTPAPKTVDYTHPELGLTFSHPDTWTMATKKGTTTFTVPLPGTTDKATLEIFSVTFSGEIDVWQSVQKDTNVQLKREVQKQWQEEFLTAPLLMTQVKYTDKTGDKTVVSGMVYSDTPRKLVFRLTSDTADFDKANFEFRSVLQTARTEDGKNLTPFDPKKPPVGIQPDVNKNYHEWREHIQPPLPGKVTKGSASTDVVVGGKQWQLRYGQGWTVTKVDDSNYSFKNASIQGAINVSIASDLDSEPAGKAFFKSSGKNLAAFASVSKRYEKGPYANRAGAQIAWAWRTGLDSGKKNLVSVDAVGASTGAYWVLTWRGNVEKGFGRERKLIDELIDQLSLEPAP